ncbi:CDP-glycerol glycerophosphotransferase (TagB/SpsB family) [Wenyingzhuangia heitensis]|uniref:CDP-glycerol glycerophosphotransferase (TagB/SpsB family) n=1 Tax=Wenyingzhuangia heitensis TaxID=1487859 RepID=A0ABX0U9C6_9FLAO|nr:hypothetical protein [Wenyingzhuangia heitensis]NIJ45435.1 CDP-glycerol glycerophosphotransferase (TagB/SpsB family) [Wenyingzhuangia heitensis]
MKRIGIVITDGVGYRNFVMSDFLVEISKKYDEVNIYSGIPAKCYNDSLIPENIKVFDLKQYKETKKVWFYRKLKEVAHMFLHRTSYGINSNLERGYPVSNSNRSLIIKLVYKITSFFHSEKIIQFYEKLQFNAFKNDKTYIEYKNILADHKPNQLFFTHQRPPYLAPFLAAAKELKIETSAFIFSWDNLASKGRMLGSFDGYLVWSKLMQKEMSVYYPYTDKNKIKVVGTPQFEPYVLDRYTITKQEFLEKFKLDSNKKIICYSCADAGIGKNDEIHIRAVLSYLKNRSDIQLLIRTSPAEDGKRFESLKNEFPEIVWNFPKWFLSREDHAEAWSQRLPSVEDVKDLKAILLYTDLNVNMLSTMSLDFMLFDKPVVNTVFGNNENGLYNDQKFLNYIHYKYVVSSKAVTIAKNEVELHQFIQEAIEQPSLRKQERKQLLDLEIGAPLPGTSERIVKALKELA